MINYIWSIFIVCGIIYGLFTNNLYNVNQTIMDSGKTSLNLIMQLFPVIAIWSGIMKIASNSKLLDKLSNFIYPIMGKLFPDIPKGDESLGLISSNIIANIFGLGNVATPFGLKAMEALQKLNSKKDTATRSMITFLVLNTSGLTIVPTTIISLRVMYGSSDPFKIVFATFLATFCSTIGGLIIDYFLARRS